MSQQDKYDSLEKQLKKPEKNSIVKSIVTALFTIILGVISLPGLLYLIIVAGIILIPMFLIVLGYYVVREIK